MKPNSSLNELKKQAFNSKCNVENVKNSLRTQFRNRVKSLREEIINSRRNLGGETSTFNPLLNSVQLERFGLVPSEILQIVEEVEKELRTEFSMNECDQYEQDTDSIINSLLEQLQECPICNKILDETCISNTTVKICDQCSNMLNME